MEVHATQHFSSKLFYFSLMVAFMLNHVVAIKNVGYVIPYNEDGQIPSLIDIRQSLVEHREPVEKLIDSMIDVAPFNNQLELIRKFKNLLFPPPIQALSEEDCTYCNILVGALKFLLNRFSFDLLQTPVTRICYLLMPDEMNQENKEVICNGSVAIQGPHVAFVIESNTPEKICYFQNLCLPNSSKIAVGRSHSRKQEVRDDRPNEKDVIRHLERRSKRDSDAQIKIVHLTDIHVDVRYLQGSLTDCGLPTCCSTPSDEGKASAYGDYSCNIPPRTIDLFLKKVVSLGLSPEKDFIIYTGDISGSRVWDETQEEVLNCSSALINSISNNLPGYRVFPCFGNHEMFPTNLYYKGNSYLEVLNRILTDWWSSIAGFTDNQLLTMYEGGYYSISIQEGLQLISYNTNFMYTKNWYNILNHENRSEVAEMVAFVENELQKAKENNFKVILIGHHPPTSGDYLVEYGHWYQQLVIKYTDIIVMQLAGHKHSDEFHLVHDNDDIAKSLLYVSTPITGGGIKNPSMRIYHLDPNTFTVIDYDQYYFHLADVVDGVEPEIKKLYSALDEYNLDDLSAESWSHFVDRLGYDDEILLKHINHYYIASRLITSCDINCKRRHICSLRHITYDQFLRCIDTIQFPPELTPTPTPSSFPTEPILTPSSSSSVTPFILYFYAAASLLVTVVFL